MHSAADLKSGRVYRRGSVDGAVLRQTTIHFEIGSYVIEHLAWMDAGQPLELLRHRHEEENYHVAVALFWSLHSMPPSTDG